MDSKNKNKNKKKKQKKKHYLAYVNLLSLFMGIKSKHSDHAHPSS